MALDDLWYVVSLVGRSVGILELFEGGDDPLSRAASVKLLIARRKRYIIEIEIVTGKKFVSFLAGWDN